VKVSNELPYAIDCVVVCPSPDVNVTVPPVKYAPQYPESGLTCSLKVSVVEPPCVMLVGVIEKVSTTLAKAAGDIKTVASIVEPAKP
jgi:hypothetical protein